MGVAAALIEDGAGAEIRGIGLAAPGVIDESARIVVQAKNLGWAGLPLAGLVEDRFGMPVGFGHDVRAGAQAEWRLGAGRGERDLAFIAVGTGISAAVIVDGAVVRRGGYAGEIGHGGSTSGAACVCGGRGCLETYASGAAIARCYTEATGIAAHGARDVLDAAQAGDPVARHVWDRAVDGLAEAISDIVRILGIRLVVMGGGVVHAGDALMDGLNRGVRARLTVHNPPRLAAAALGADAGLHGAGLLGWDRISR
jgi:glucokinase